MDVILHIGAHRCATTSFQDYMRRNRPLLAEAGTGFWGPYRTRTGLFRGLGESGKASRRALGRVQLNLRGSQRRGMDRLVVSEENMLGAMRVNLRDAALYPDAGLRIVRHAEAFGPALTDLVLNIRALDLYWASVMGFALARGYGLPHRRMLDRIAFAPRSWRDVIAEIACAVPDARLWVLPFETFAGRPEAQLAAVTGRPAPRNDARGWCNRTPRLPQLRAGVIDEVARELPNGDGRWMPFDAVQADALRERYADDLMWLAGGADGLAWLMDDPERKPAGQTLPISDMTRGRRNEQDRRLAGAG
ncbi:hypothetical protein ACFORG_15475 [Lutimaribacter marinistellae]|uniref:Sulfotransferase family protein n=1 Tax=Lutimaribacter marinistellae TaxID=1820329 RepID=A0ABV7TIP0_9RHOB